jgi:hypothetical protein
MGLLPRTAIKEHQMKFLKSTVMTCALLAFASPGMAAETGTVTETLDAGGYVYMKLESGQWIAATPFAVSKGDKVQYSDAMEMNDFHSKGLDKTFESILFASSASLVGGDSADKSVAMPSGTGMPLKATESQAPEPGEIKPLADGKTIADMYAESGQLKDKVVSLRAKVTKMNRNIMGRNWITLKDGTGTEPGIKLVATSQEVVKVGDVVIAKGKISTDVDLGRGYFYEVMLEEATFSPGVE